MRLQSTASHDLGGRTRSRVSFRELARVNRVLRSEFFSGLLVMLAAFLGFLAVNSPLTAAYTALRDWRIGPAALDLHLSLGT